MFFPHLFNLAFILTQLRGTIGTHNKLGLEQIPRSDSIPSQSFDGDVMWAPPDWNSENGFKDAATSKEVPKDLRLASTISKGLRLKSKISQPKVGFPPPPPLRSRSRKFLQAEGNDLEDILRTYVPSQRVMLADNVIPVIRVSSGTEKDPSAKHWEKVRQVQAIQAALRMYDEKLRMKSALDAVINDIKTRDKIIHDARREKTRQPAKFRRAMFSHKQKVHPERRMTPALPPVMGGFFEPKSRSPTPNHQFDQSRPRTHQAIYDRFPPPTKTYGSESPLKFKLSPENNDVLIVQSSPKAALNSKWMPADNPASFPAASLPLKPSKIPAAGFGGIEFAPLTTEKNNPPFNSGSGDMGSFFDFSGSPQKASISQTSGPGTAFGFQDGFHSFSVTPESGKTQSQSAAIHDNFEPDDSWAEVGFDTDNDDCAIIDSKSCQSDLDCSCFGFYTCAEGKCQSKQAGSSGHKNGNPGSGGWHEQPISFGFSRRSADRADFGGKPSSVGRSRRSNVVSGDSQQKLLLQNM